MKNLALSEAILSRLDALAQQRHCSVETLLETCLENLETGATTETTSIHHMLTSEVLELASDAVVVIDDTQNIVAFNSGAERIFGYRVEEVIGQSLNILLPEDQWIPHRDHVQAFLDHPDGKVHMASRDMIHGKRKDGTQFPADASLLRYIENEQVYYAALMRDVSRREELYEKLRDREKTLRLITENTTDLICLHKPDGTLLYVSPSINQFSGHSPEELIGTSPYDYFFGKDIPNIRDSHQAALRDKKTQSMVYRFQRPGGEQFWVETLTNPILNEAGEIVNLVTVTRDVSDRVKVEQELQEERDLLALLMDTSPSAITVMDKNGQFTFANQRAADVAGMDRDSLTMRDYSASNWQATDYDGTPRTDERMPFHQVLEAKEPVWDMRLVIQRPDGNHVYLSVNGAPIMDENGEVSRIIFAAEDYTQRKIQHDALEAALKREKRLNELKSDFITLVSHEFRTPMAIIMTSTGILKKKLETLNPEELFSRLDKIETQIRRLDTLISDITFINKDDMVGHKVVPIAVNLAQFFDQLIEEVNTAHPEHRPVQVHAESIVDTVHLDPNLMQQVFVNLLSNAMKYSPDESTVLCRYTCTPKSLEVVIADEGIGIPPEDRKDLFKEFHRAGNTGFVQGTGLGLAIVKRALDMMHGTIEYDSQLDSGTHFRVSLPIAAQ